ncbi:MAG TPA: matrixin family metalloprotease [Dehalococcoidia bacterium]|nr:matrixin family metalloprotease [Dehalococcoidia bacterium]
MTPGDVKQLTLVFYQGPPSEKGKPADEPEPSYVLIGLKLYETATYYVNPEGSGVDPEAVKAAIGASFEAWDEVTDFELFNDTVGTTDFRGREYDGQNAISWVLIVPPKIVALCTIWYEGELDPDNPARVLEFDICFNMWHEWGIDPDGEGTEYTIDAFDIQNVATHEAGHPVGLDDLEEEQNSEQTMYGSTTEGETKKISLHPDGDIIGAQELYGAPAE